MLVLAAINFASIEKVVTFLVMLSILVVLHEYGHFIVARRNKVKINEFAVGMGPKIVGWTSPRSGTLYAIRALPIGGYCAMEGEDNKSSEAEQQRDFAEQFVADPKAAAGNFQSKTPWQRLGIIVAGPVANFILAYVILLVGALAFGVPSQQIDRAVVTQVVPGTPAAKADLRPGDRIVAIQTAGRDVADASKLIDTIHASLGKPMNVTYVRDGAQKTIHVVPAPCPQNAKQGCIGFVPQPAYERVGFLDALRYSGIGFVNIADQTVSSLGLLVTHFTKYAGQVSGPVGMGQAAGVIQDFGWGPYFALAATISFALGVFNLLPFPALDGGRGAFIIAELVRGKPVDPDREAMVHIAGFAALMALMVIVAFHDITRIISGKGVF